MEWVNMSWRKLWRVYQRGLEQWLGGLLQSVFDMGASQRRHHPLRKLFLTCNKTNTSVVGARSPTPPLLTLPSLSPPLSPLPHPRCSHHRVHPEVDQATPHRRVHARSRGPSLPANAPPHLPEGLGHLRGRRREIHGGREDAPRARGRPRAVVAQGARAGVRARCLWQALRQGPPGAHAPVDRDHLGGVRRGSAHPHPALALQPDPTHAGASSPLQSLLRPSSSLPKRLPQPLSLQASPL